MDMKGLTQNAFQKIQTQLMNAYDHVAEDSLKNAALEASQSSENKLPSDPSITLTTKNFFR